MRSHACMHAYSTREHTHARESIPVINSRAALWSFGSLQTSVPLPSMPLMPSASYVPLGTPRTLLVARTALDGPSEQLLLWCERYGLPGVGETNESLEDYFMDLESREKAARARKRANSGCEATSKHHRTLNDGVPSLSTAGLGK